MAVHTSVGAYLEMFVDERFVGYQLMSSLRVRRATVERNNGLV